MMWQKKTVEVGRDIVKAKGLAIHTVVLRVNGRKVVEMDHTQALELAKAITEAVKGQGERHRTGVKV